MPYKDKEEEREHRKKYQLEHRERIKKYQEKYRQEHKAETKKTSEKYRNERREELRQKARKYYREHKEEQRKHNKTYSREHREELLEYQKNYREQHKEELKQWRKKNKEWFRKHRRENPEMYAKALKKYQQTEKGKKKHLEHNRWGRVRKAHNGEYYSEYHTEAEWEALKKHYDCRCLCCGKQEPEIKLDRDHVIPLTLKGSDEIENIQPLCKSCNSRKGNKYIDFREQT